MAEGVMTHPLLRSERIALFGQVAGSRSDPTGLSAVTGMSSA